MKGQAFPKSARAQNAARVDRTAGYPARWKWGMRRSRQGPLPYAVTLGGREIAFAPTKAAAELLWGAVEVLASEMYEPRRPADEAVWELFDSVAPQPAR